MSFIDLTAHQIAQQVKSQKVSCREITEDFLQRIEQVENDVKAFVTVLPEEALVICGHGPATTIGREKELNPFLT